MDPGTLAFFERRFGRDFSGVRVHTGPEASRRASALRARAYTVGRDVVFGSGEYRPEDRAGSRLIAHELAHVVQQGSGSGSPTAEDRTIRRFPYDGRLLGPQGLDITDEVNASNVSSWTEDRRIAAIRQILADWWVGPTDEWALEKLWSSFGADLERVCSESDHLELFRRSADRGMEVTELEIPEVQADLDRFEEEAVERVNAVLDVSEQEVRREMVRLGISWTVEWTHHGAAIGGTYMPSSTTHYSLRETPQLAGLAAAAGQLLHLREELQRLHAERARAETSRWRQREGFPTPGVDRLASHEWEIHVLSPLRRDIASTEREYEMLRQAHEARFPILATFADRPSSRNRAALRTMSRSATDPSAAAEVLGETVRSHLDDIATTRRRIDGESEAVWRLPRVVSMTMRHRGWSEHSFEGEMVRARADEADADEAFVDTVLGAMAVGLGLLAAVPTGGSSLLATAAVLGAGGSLAVNTAIAARSLSRYQLEAAASGTAFDRARAISGSDPSLFWVALDIAGVFLELGPAIRVFEGAAPTIRRAIAANPTRSADDVERVLRDLATGHVPASELDDALRSIRRQIERIQEGEGAAAGLRRQLDEVDAAIRAGTSEAVDRSTRLADIEEGLHHLNVSPGGMLVRCSDRCTFVRQFYQTELAEDPALLRRLDDIETAMARGQVDADLVGRARDLMRDLKRARARPVAEFLGDTDELYRLLARELPPGMGDELLVTLERVARDLARNPEADPDWLRRMVQVLAHTEDPGIYHRMLETRVRVSSHTGSGAFHVEGSFYWGRMNNPKEMSMLEAQLRGYRPSAGRGAEPRVTGSPGRVLDESTTAGGAAADIVVGAPQGRLNLEEALETRGEVRREIQRLRDAGDEPSQALVRRMERMEAMLSERLHASGAGFGIELSTGIAHGPQIVNQVFQNQGVERLIRFLHATRPEGVQYRVLLDLDIGDGDMLRRITYRVEAIEPYAGIGPPRQIRPMFEATIGVPQGEIRTAGRIRRGGRDIDVVGVELEVEPNFGALAEHLGYGAAAGRSGSAQASDFAHPAAMHAEDVARLDLHSRNTNEFPDVDFRQTDLRDVNFVDASLVRTDLRGVDLTTTDLRGADLTGARLEGARLPSLESGGLEGATLPDGTPFAGPVDLTRFTDPTHPHFFDPLLLYQGTDY